MATALQAGGGDEADYSSGDAADAASRRVTHPASTYNAAAVDSPAVLFVVHLAV